MTPHNEANKNDIAKIVIMPGDPLRAKYIAENFLTDYRLVNKVRAMYAYTGKYKGKEITIMGHGMGMPSAGIYTYELYRHYDVDSIIRIGSCGAYVPSLNLFDVILADQVYTESNYAL
ncbi:MAG TPA: purine nucleoside phosphorylase DeoD-type, partial [Candidatus Merdicola faecigallinarum]|nr:purine nucleoside phosphorylase DeoD-type [Candidatus Merdicola faecigallinarum]